MKGVVLRTLLRLYPRQFRRTVGDGWQSTALDLLHRERGLGRVRAWATILGDSVREIPLAYAEARQDPPLGALRRGDASTGSAPGQRRQRPSGDEPPLPRAIALEGRRAGRELLRRPRFTLACALVLGVGVGVNTAVFSVANAAFFRPLDYEDADRLMLVWGDWRSSGFPTAPLSPPQLLALAEATDVFESVGGIWATNSTITGGELPEQVSMGLVTPSFLPTLGVDPAIGRWLDDDDALAALEGRTGSVVLSHGYWQARFGSDESVIGQTLSIDGSPAVIVGVLRERFRLLLPEGGGVPPRLDLFGAFPPLDQVNPGNFYLRTIARLRHDRTPAQARERLAETAARLQTEQESLAATDVVFAVHELRTAWAQHVRSGVLGLQACALMLLLLTLTNVTSLFVARAIERLPEFSVCACLGARRSSLLRQLTIEGLGIAALSAALGLLLGAAVVRGIWSLRPDTLARLGEVTPDFRVAIFAAVVSLLGLVVLSVGPMLLIARAEPSRFLAGRGTGGAGRGGQWMRRAATVAQIASTIVLLVGAALMARTVANLEGVDTGFESSDRIAFAVGLPVRQFPSGADRGRLAREIREAVAELPGVHEVGGSSHLPLATWVNWAGEVRPAEQAEDPANSNIIDHRAVTDGYFAAVGARIIEGRAFTADDDLESEPVAIVDSVLAARLWPGESPMNRRAWVSQYRDGIFEPVTATIVGVVDGIRDRTIAEPSPGQAFLPFAQTPRWELSYVVHADDPARLVEPIRHAVARVDSQLAGSGFRLLADDVDKALSPARFGYVLAAVVAAVALLLSAVGLYGVISLHTRSRDHEIGVRIALGARANQVFRMVMADGLQLGALGIALGGPLAYVLARALRANFFGVGAFDPWTYTAAAAMVILVVALACGTPAGRATRSDPVQALRSG